MNAYKITLRYYNADGSFTVVNADSPGQAKYRHFLMLDDLFEDFGTYLSAIKSCVKVVKNPAIIFGDEREFRRTAIYRHVPEAYLGMSVELSSQFHGRKGIIVGANDSCNFDILFDDGVFNCHPNHELVYFDRDGNVVYDFRTQNK